MDIALITHVTIGKGCPRPFQIFTTITLFSYYGVFPVNLYIGKLKNLPNYGKFSF